MRGALDSRHALINARTNDFKNDTARTTSFSSLVGCINRIRDTATKRLGVIAYNARQAHE